MRHELNEIKCDPWLDSGHLLTDDEKLLLDTRLTAYESDPDAGCSWEELETRVLSRINGCSATN